MLVTIATYNQIYLADLDKARLLDYNVPCVIQDQNMVGMNLFYSTAVGGIKLQVPESYAELALKILNDSEGTGDEHDVVSKPTCPRCKSDDILPKRYNPLLLLFSSLLLGFGDILFSTTKSKYRCSICGKQWEMVEDDEA
jgi:hypothetical protein